MDKFPEITAIPCGNLHDLVAGNLPSNGEWHKLTSYVRNTESGEFQIDEMLLRRLAISDVKFTKGVKYDGVFTEPTASYPDNDSKA